MTSLVVRKAISSRGVIKLKLVRVERKAISEGVVKLERVQVICPGCGQQVEAVAGDGRVKGYCAVAKQYVDFLIETQRARAGNHFTAETKAKMSAAHKECWQDPEYQARQIATHKKCWQDPEYRAKQIAARKKRWQDPEYRAKQSAVQKKRWQDPGYRAKRSAALTGKSG